MRCDAAPLCLSRREFLIGAGAALLTMDKLMMSCPETLPTATSGQKRPTASSRIALRSVTERSGT